MPYAVPDSYFENFASQVLSAIHHNATNADVPAGYFDNLPQTILEKVRGLEVTNELENVAPLLNTISKNPPHYLPENYFETLTPKAFESTPVINITTKKTWQRWAVAAAIGAITMITASLYFQNNNTQVTLAATTENADYTLPGTTEITAALRQINDNELADYVSDMQSSTEIQQSLFYLNTTDNFENALKDFTESELQEQIVLYPPYKKNS